MPVKNGRFQTSKAPRRDLALIEGSTPPSVADLITCAIAAAVPPIPCEPGTPLDRIFGERASAEEIAHGRDLERWLRGT